MSTADDDAGDALSHIELEAAEVADVETSVFVVPSDLGEVVLVVMIVILFETLVFKSVLSSFSHGCWNC